MGRALGHDLFGRSGPRSLKEVVIIVTGIALSGSGFAFGRGLCSLRPWARRTLTALLVPFFAFEVYGSVVTARGEGLLPGFGLLAAFALPSAFILTLLFSRKGATVFSAEYRSVIARTPGLRYRPSRRTKLACGVILGLVAVGIAIALALGSE